MNHSDLQDIISQTIDHGEPRTYRVRTPDHTKTTQLEQQAYLGTVGDHYTDTVTVTQQPNNLNDVYATLQYDNDRDAVTLDARDSLLMIRHGIQCRHNSPSITDLRQSDDAQIALTTGQTRHSMQQQDNDVLREGTTRLTHRTTYKHLLGISNDDAYRRTRMMNDASHHVDTASTRPRADATPEYDPFQTDPSPN